MNSRTRKSPSQAPGERAGSSEQTSIDALTEQLLRIITELALEIHPHLRTRIDLNLDSDLDRDAALDSLARAELILRLDRAFKIHLPETLIVEAASPRDLLQTIRAAAPKGTVKTARRTKVQSPLAAVREPKSAQTLPEVLEAHLAATPDRPHIWLWRRDEEQLRTTYADLDNGARKVAAGLVQRGLRQGERVAIMLPTSMDFFEVFLGILLAGGVPVPIYPPFRRTQIEEHLRRQAGILRNAEAAFLVTDEEIHRVGTLLRSLTDSLREVEVAEVLRRSTPLSGAVELNGNATALIQYTSGSTGDPKGVVLSHANLLSNIRAMGTSMQATSSDVFVSWLPLYHDMGLIGAWLGCMYFGVPTIIMPPLAFLADPTRWLWAIHQHSATLSAAPNFAYELCLKNVRDEDIEGLDLSSLRMMVNGAEPISPSTLQRFTERFEKYGFRAEAMAPVYGLAESSVGLAFPPVGRAPIIDRVERVALSSKCRAQVARVDDQTALQFVACGQPLPGHEIRVIDDRGRELPERREGRVQFTGPSATTGYYRDAEKTKALFDGRWLETGDRGYIAAGDLYLTGRTKDMIIRAGRNIYPHELEELVGNIEGVRKGCVAAFPSSDRRTGTERLVVLAETRLTDDVRLENLRRQISDASTALIDLPPDEIILAPPRAVPKTSSGKIRRSHAREMYENGLVGTERRSLWWQIVRLSISAAQHRAKRTAGALGEFGYAAWWWIALCVLACMTWPTVLLLPRRNWRHAFIGGVLRLFFRLTGIKFEVTEETPLPGTHVIVVANHSSYLDGAVLSAAIPGLLSFVAKQELKNQIVAGPFLRKLGTVFVRRADVGGSLEDSSRIAQFADAGERLVYFPEATLTRMPGLLGFRLGAFQLSVRAGLPVVPVTISGTRSVLRGDQWFPRRAPISVHIGTPHLPEGDDFGAALKIRDAVRHTLLAQSGEPDLAHERVDLPSD